MGAWGKGTFQNDDALDWVGDLCDGGDDRLIIDSLKAARKELAEEDYLAAPTGCSAFAAAEAVAALHGYPLADLPENLSKQLKEFDLKPDSKLLKVAREAVELVTTDERSELRGLWADAGAEAFEAWIATTADISKRLAD